MYAGKRFFKGLTFPLVGQGAINAVVFGVESLIYKRLAYDGQTLNVTISVLAGLCAGAVQTVTVCPIELIKIRIQKQFTGGQNNSKSLRFKTQSREKKIHQLLYLGPLKMTRSVFDNEGVKGMYRGWWITLL